MVIVCVPNNSHGLSALLSGAGFVAAEEEAGELLARAAGDDAMLRMLVARRLTGEPLAWITGRTSFCDLEILIESGVYVPRQQSQALARRAIEYLPDAGVAVDLCTGSGAIARALAVSRPRARIMASDLDGRAIHCARANGVTAYQGDLFSPLPADIRGQVDVVVSVPPYVPTPALPLLQRDTLTFESPRSYDGGLDGTDILRRILTQSPQFLRPGGIVLVELGGEEADTLRTEVTRLGYVDVAVLLDGDEDDRGLVAIYPGSSTPE